MTPSLRRTLGSFALPLALACQLTPAPVMTEHVTEYRNGAWFNGESFDSATWYAVGADLRSRRPSRVDEVVDLKGQSVVSPYAEGHNHWLEPALFLPTA